MTTASTKSVATTQANNTEFDSKYKLLQTRSNCKISQTSKLKKRLRFIIRDHFPPF